ncbi:MAG TPA: hypothetical protein VFI47_28180 [Acidimicrobiales bacterium]|nr:hypothetical protein [Acidimicrobiales bacterium]
MAGTGRALRGAGGAGGRRSGWRRAPWRVECERSGADLTVRSWHLPDAQFLAIDRLGLPETAAILTSVHVGG